MIEVHQYELGRSAPHDIGAFCARDARVLMPALILLRPEASLLNPRQKEEAVSSQLARECVGVC